MRSAAAFAFAALLHAAALGALVAGTDVPDANRQAARERDTRIEIELVEPVRDALPNARVNESATTLAAATRSQARRGNRGLEPSEQGTEPSVATEAREAPEAHGTSDEPWTFRSERTDLGLGDQTGALARAAGVEQDESDRVARGITAAGDAADRARGHARGTPLRMAIEDVARSSDAPLTGSATFEITVGADKKPRARFLDSSSHELEWASLVSAIDREAAKKTLRLPPSGEGLRVVVRVTAELVLPDGRRQKDLGVKTETHGPELRDRVAPGESKLVLPSATLKLGGKVCSLSLTLGVTASPIGGGCNPEMIGARTSRRVKSELVSEERVTLADR